MTTIPPNPDEALVTISTPAPDTVRIRDRVESSRFEFYFDDDVEITPAPTDSIYFPVDVAAEVRGIPSLVIPTTAGLIIHDHNTGAILRKAVKNKEEVQLPKGQYEIEIMSSPMKIYIYTDSEIGISRREERVRLSLGEVGQYVIGARSHHERPANTITVDRSVESVMKAVSTFGSALKTTSVERSWPTLRGYPPQVRVGDKLEIPDSISVPDTGVTIEIPDDLEAVFKVTPLAYYLSAEVTPKSSTYDPSRVKTPEETIELGENLAESASRLLQDTLMLDSVVRTEGLYTFNTYERSAVEDSLPWQPEDVVNLPIDERISAYEQVPEEALEKIRPVWPLTVDVCPSYDAVPSLSHLAEELAVVRIPSEETSDSIHSPNFVDEFMRSDGGDSLFGNRTTESSADTSKITSPSSWNTQMHTSLLDEYPLGSNKTSVRAYNRHIERTAPDTDTIEVHVVCNDDEMREEEVVTELYGVRDLLEFDVNIHYRLTREEFRDLLSKSFDLVHYIGHIDEEGILCEDGYLDMRTDVSEVGVDVFLLNACTSVEQGEAFLELGSMGGIVTLFDVPNSSATQLGRTLSRLLNRGFTVRAALEIAREASVLGRRWVSLGDGRASLTQTESGVPYVINIEKKRSDTFSIEIEWFETNSHRIGSLVGPKTDWAEYHVIPNTTETNVTESELQELFSLEVAPVRYEGNLFWTDETSPSEL